MADPADIAAKLQQMHNDLAAAKRRPGPDIRPNGHCHYCGEDILAPKLYCDSDCADDHDRETRR